MTTMIAGDRNDLDAKTPKKAPAGAAAANANSTHVLVVEDEADLADMISYHLSRDGYTCEIACSGNDAVEMIRRRRPDVIVLDRMLPGLSGDTVLSQLRRDPETVNVPVIMLTAKSEESDELVGFALGANDYVTKPFSVKVLRARIAALLARRDAAEQSTETLSEGPIRLDVAHHEVTVDGQRVHLTATEFRILSALMKARARVLNRGQLIDIIFGTTVAVTDRTIDVHITALRRKLGDAATWIQTVRGVGYTFRPPG